MLEVENVENRPPGLRAVDEQEVQVEVLGWVEKVIGHVQGRHTLLLLSSGPDRFVQ